MKGQKILPLRPIELNSKPLNQRAIAWSRDAELAVAADDSFYIFLPEFPVIDPNTLPEGNNEDDQDQSPAGRRDDAKGMGVLRAGLSSNREQGDDELLSSDSEADMDAEGDEDPDQDVEMEDAAQNGTTKDAPDNRQQFADEGRRFPVSRPSLTPEINAHIWKAVGKGMPVIHEGKHNEEDGIVETVPVNNDDEYKAATEQQNDNAESVYEANYHPGAGIGVIGSTGTSLNHVVAIDWSPAGLGRNLRPVLAVLTGCGSLIVYGEGSPLPFRSTVRPLKSARGPKDGGAVRNLDSWLALWAVGENFVVPGQEAYGYGEYVKAFAWCQEIGPGKALLAYMNDLRELVILSVSTTFKRLGNSLEEAVWQVSEVLRVETSGPHEQADVYDPDFLPGGSSYCVRWSPWLKDGTTWSCLLSYMDTNYIGFRRITLNVTTWAPAETPIVTCDPQDWDGRCLSLGADAFLEFENTVWNIEGKKACRGFIATPLVAEPFEVDLAKANPDRPKTGHSTEHCQTTYPTESVTNPITGLVVHPVDLQTVSPSIIPLYTAVRLSATASNTGWWESSHPQRRNRREEPQWVTEIQNRISAKMALDEADKAGDGGSESGDDGVEHFGNAEEENNEDGSDDEDDEDNDAIGIEGSGFQNERNGDIDMYTNPEVHPQRALLWGIAISPGGGSTAVLTSSQNTQKPQRGTWNHYHSQVMFEYANRRVKPKEAAGNAAAEKPRAEGHHDYDVVENAADVEGLSTEARLWEWLYGNGAGVPALTYYASLPSSETATTETTNTRLAAHQTKDAKAQVHRDKIKSLFTSLVGGQTCAICADGNTKLIRDTPSSSKEKERQLDCRCEQGHRFTVCGASGLAIMQPGVSRCCGICRSRCLDVEVLAEMLDSIGKRDEAEVVRREVNGNVCVQCGGKYLD